MNKIKKYSCLLLAFVFTLFAALQYNDPDPEVWISIYMTMSVLCIVALFRPVSKIFLLLLTAGCIIAAFLLFPSEYQGVSMPMNERVPAVEEARESFGLLICAAAMLWLYFMASGKKMVYGLQ